YKHRPEHYARAETLAKTMVDLTNSDPTLSKGDALDSLAETYAEMKDYDKAVPLFEQSLEERDKSGNSLTFMYRSNLAELVYKKLSDFAKAEQLLTQNSEKMAASFGADNHNFSYYVNQPFSRLYEAWGQWDKAAKHIDCTEHIEKQYL